MHKSGDWSRRNQNHLDQWQSGKLSKGSRAKTFPRAFVFSFNIGYVFANSAHSDTLVSDLPCSLKIHPSFLAARDVSLFLFFSFFPSFSLLRKVASGEEKRRDDCIRRLPLLPSWEFHEGGRN